MGTTPFNRPLTPPHRRAAWAGAVDTDKEIEAMLPKDILKHAEKVKGVEAEVLKVLSKKPAVPTPARGFIEGLMDPIFQAGQIVQADVWQQQAQAQRREMDRQARELERAYMADVQQTPWIRWGS